MGFSDAQMDGRRRDMEGRPNALMLTVKKRTFALKSAPLFLSELSVNACRQGRRFR